MRYAIIASLAVIWLLFGCPGYLADPSASWWLRASTYHLFHANLLHLVVNSIAIWTVFRKTPWRKHPVSDLVIGYIIATLMFCTAARPVVGFSNILFAVIGLRTPRLSSPWWRKGEVDLFFVFTFATILIPSISAVTHIVSLLCGILISMARRKAESTINTIDNDYRRASR